MEQQFFATTEPFHTQLDGAIKQRLVSSGLCCGCVLLWLP